MSPMNGCLWEETVPPTDDDWRPSASAAGHTFQGGDLPSDFTERAKATDGDPVGSENVHCGARSTQRGHYELIPLADLPDQPVRPEDVLWGDILFRGATTVLAGQPGAGKTTWARCVAVAVATGGEFCGFRGPPRGAPVIYLDYETAGSYRAPRWKRAYGDDLSSATALFVNERYPLFEPEALVAAAKERGAALIIVDTLARAVNAHDENSNSEMSRIMEGFDLVAREANCAVLVLTHQSKGRTEGYRGASAIGASAAVLVSFARAASDKGAEEDSAIYVLSIEKNRLGSDGSIRLMRDGDGGFKLAPGSVDSADVSRAHRAILDVLDDAGEPMQRKDILSAVSRRLTGAGKAPSDRTIERALDQLHGLGRVLRPAMGIYQARTGKGPE